MLISKETTLQIFDNIPTINGICTEPVVTVRDVKEIIKAVPEVDAIPLDKLCECLAERYEPPYALVDIDKLKMPIDFRQQKEIWMNALTNWMEESNRDAE